MSSQEESRFFVVSIEEELKKSYLEYAMSVIIDRALPDARDGLKPVHRRILYSMNEMNNYHNTPYKKSARVVGHIMGKYHPHGDMAIYDSIVRMAQEFSMRYVLIDGQGNFGSVDGDAAAAMRYTEIRMTELSQFMLMDLDKKTVNFVKNYDGQDEEPTVLPACFPNLLVNGASGIAVGMATNIPPHNLGEVIHAALHLLDHESATLEDLMQYIKAPDFPTRGIIHYTDGIKRAYETGNGSVILRATAEIVSDSRKQQIIISALPYQVNKASLIKKIAELSKEKKIEGIVYLRDESDQKGMCVVIDVRNDSNAKVVLNNLFRQTELEITYHMNIVALDRGVPKKLNLKQLLELFLQHRKEVVTRRTHFELKKALQHVRLLEGLFVALLHIDEVIQLIKQSKDTAEAKQALLAKKWFISNEIVMFVQKTQSLCKQHLLTKETNTYITEEDSVHYQLSEEQVQHILDLKLHRLTSLEQDKLRNNYMQDIALIESLLAIVNSKTVLHQIIREELMHIVTKFSEPRRTMICHDDHRIDNEHLIPREKCIVTLSRDGYVKAQSLSDYDLQKKGGVGKTSSTMKQEDLIKKLLVCDSHQYLLFFSTLGKVYWLKTYQLPRGNRTSKGRPIVNFLKLSRDEKITTVLPLDVSDAEHKYVFMATSLGWVKKIPLKHFMKPRSSGLIVINLSMKNQLIGAMFTDGLCEVLLFSRSGKVIHFNESEVRSMGRNTIGVQGMILKNEEDVVISLIISDKVGDILTVTENGYGKRTVVDAHRLSKRRGKGVVAINTGTRNGLLISALQVNSENELLLITSKARLIRLSIANIHTISRTSKGSRLIKLKDEERLVDISQIQELDKEE